MECLASMTSLWRRQETTGRMSDGLRKVVGWNVPSGTMEAECVIETSSACSGSKKLH